MTELVLRILERIHGHLGWLSVAALVHPAVLLRNPKRRARLATSTATILATLASLLGALVYPSYRLLLKQALFRQAPRIGWMFERKEHLAVGIVIFAWVGAIAHWSALGLSDGPLRLRLARMGHRAYVAAATFGVVVGVLGVAVAAIRTF